MSYPPRNLGVAFVDLVHLEGLEKTASAEEPGGVAGGPVGEAEAEPVAGEFWKLGMGTL